MDDRPLTAGKPRARRRRMWLIAIIISPAAIVACILGAAAFWQDPQSADDRLAEIEAARAIPDSENAAIVYDELLRDPNARSPLDHLRESVEKEDFDRARHEPWRRQDYPELAAWVEEHQYIIDKLLEASRLEKCRFPICIDIIIPASEMDRAIAVRGWGFLLTLAANNDLAEGRNEGAMEKWRCLFQIGSHLGQHPGITDHLLGRAVTSMAIGPMARFIVAGNAPESRLQEIETLWLPTESDLSEQLDAVRSVEDLRAQKLKESFGPGGRLVYAVMTFRATRTLSSSLDNIADEWRCAIQGIHILIALQRHHMATDRWPHRLDEVKSLLSQESLTDPLNGGSFVYKPTADAFSLYSKGRNNIDENGQHDPNGPDDWPIWPLPGQTQDSKQIKKDAE